MRMRQRARDNASAPNDSNELPPLVRRSKSGFGLPMNGSLYVAALETAAKVRIPPFM
jgi:hypothetical protein